MIAPLTLTDKRFNMLKVVSRVENTKRGGTQWKCKCDCGNEKIAAIHDLQSGATRSCGCLKAEMASKRLKNPRAQQPTTVWHDDCSLGTRKCKECKRIAAKRSHLLRTYGLEWEDYQSILKKQNYKCGICRCNFKKICVDHDHKTGIIRGLLCYRCNEGLGKLRDNYQTVSSASRYLGRVEWSELIQCKTQKLKEN